MIELTGDTRALWYVELPGGNWTATLAKAEGEDQAKIQFRFRWFKDAKVWDSDDKRSFYTATTGGDIEKAVANTRRTIAAMKLIGAGQSWELLRGTAESMEEFSERLLALPFVQGRDLMGNNLKPGQEGAKEH